jgi:hypothetical protein
VFNPVFPGFADPAGDSDIVWSVFHGSVLRGVAHDRFPPPTESLSGLHRSDARNAFATAVACDLLKPSQNFIFPPDEPDNAAPLIREIYLCRSSVRGLLPLSLPVIPSP